MSPVEAFLTNADSAMLLAVAGGLIGLAFQRFLGIWIKPKYFLEKSCK